MVRLITDSAADFEPFELEKLKIACIPIKVMLGENEYEENVNLTKDQFFGEMGIIEGYPRSATAVALGDVTELSVIAKNDFEDYCKRKPEKTILIMKNWSLVSSVSSFSSLVP